MKTIEFEKQNKQLILCYTPDDPTWIKRRLSFIDDFYVKKIFCVNASLAMVSEDEVDDTFRFRIGDVGEHYTKIYSTVISTEHDFYFSNDINLTMKMFSAYHPNASPLKIITEQLANKANILRNNRKSCEMNQHLFKKL